MNKKWNKRHGHLLSALIEILDSNSIRYFILRNYEGLPDINFSKDIDIIVDPTKLEEAKKLLKSAYKQHQLTRYYEVQYDHVYCCYGINESLNISIHIDFIASYISKGYEIFSFNELYKHTELYNNIRVLNKLYDAIMLFIYKQFNYGIPLIKEAYLSKIHNINKSNPEFRRITSELIGKELCNKMLVCIEQQDSEKLLQYSKEFTRKLRKYCWRVSPLKTLRYTMGFIFHKFHRIIFRYNKYAKTFAAISPDGGGKTFFLEELIKRLNHLFVNDDTDSRCNIYHFRFNLFPNLGELGEKINIVKQDVDFTEPHRAKPVGFFNSLIRITYYWLDYVIGWSICVRKDVKFDKFTVFDRFSYDFLVDPFRSRLKLPYAVRNFFVSLMRHPQIVFFLDAPAHVIYKRKQELTLDEIERQLKLYRKVSGSNKEIQILNANRDMELIVNEALAILLNQYTQPL